MQETIQVGGRERTFTLVGEESTRQTAAILVFCGSKQTEARPAVDACRPRRHPGMNTTPDYSA